MNTARTQSVGGGAETVYQHEMHQPAALGTPLATVSMRTRGELDGQAEVWQMLASAQQQKGAVLTKRDIHTLYSAHIAERQSASLRGEGNKDWMDGWMYGFITTCLLALNAAPNPDGWMHLPPERSEPVTPATFRKATIQVTDPDTFFSGLRWGQTAQVEEEQQPMTAAYLVAVFTDNLINHPSGVTTDWLLGYVIGRVDALLQDRQTTPVGWMERSAGTRGGSCV